VRIWWDLRAEFPVTLQQKFCEGLQFSFVATKKRSSLDFLSFDSKNASNTAKPMQLLQLAFQQWSTLFFRDRLFLQQEELIGVEELLISDK